MLSDIDELDHNLVYILMEWERTFYSEDEKFYGRRMNYTIPTVWSTSASYWSTSILSGKSKSMNELDEGELEDSQRMNNHLNDNYKKTK